MWIALILGIALLGIGLGFYIPNLKKFVKNNSLTKFSKIDYEKNGISIGLIAVSSICLILALSLKHDWEMSFGQVVLSYGGGFILFVSLTICLSCFYVYYYKLNFEFRKQIFNVMIITIITSLIGCFLFLLGIGNLIKYPLVSGITIGGSSFLDTFTCISGKGDGISVAFYGIIMVSSVVVVYWICDHEFYKKFKKHGILDAVVVLVFPAGVIGARIGYVIGEWNTQGIDGWTYWITQGNCFKLWNGGLTILGGALGGIITGVIFVKLRRKYVDVRWAMDVIVPCILLAQAIGRWGNFFNHEVYGEKVLAVDWSFLPNFIRNQMAVSWSNGAPNSEYIYVPLFLIESIINVCGFFLIKYGMGRLVPKYLPQGSLCGGYLLWYGIVRAIMEPLRDPEFNMGSNGIWSNIWALIYIALGILVIGFFFLLDHLKEKKAKGA